MKKTLLEMVQNILSALNGDEVNSIGDSVEALQVAEEIRTAYEVLLQEYRLDFQKASIRLEPSLDPARPTHMRLPDNVVQIDWIRYNRDTADWQPVHFMEPEAFVKRSLSLANQDTVQLISDFNGTPLYISDNQPPSYYTTFDEEWLIFDAYNKTVDTTLQNSKTLAWGIVEPEFRMEDDFVPRLRAEGFPRLLSEAKSASFINIKQVSNSKEEQRSRRMITQNQALRNRLKAKQSSSLVRHDYSRP
jgi:hypothetical protein